MQLDIEKLSVDFYVQDLPVNAVKETSLSIGARQTIGLVGESGSGKSTLGLSIARLLPEPSARIKSGKILYNGEDLLKASGNRLQQIRGGSISYVFQEPASSLNPVLTIGRQLIEAIELHTELKGNPAKERAVQLCSQVEIPDARERLNSYPHELSGGMKQRIMIAMALAGRPELIIADEPTTALDVTIERQIVLLLKKLQREMPLSMLLISHNIHLVKELSERIAIMSNGSIVEEGPCLEILQNPRHEYTKKLLSAQPKVAVFEGV